ncbi:MAG: hypothetical protein ISN64_03380 [Rickettsia sp.]|nr:hypothetical protein [Rickettsia sp.]
MSFLELITIFLISLLVLDIKDFQFIFKKFSSLYKQLENLKTQFITLIDSDSEFEESQDMQIQDKVKNIDQMNKMIKKIIEIEGEYKGDYSFQKVKLHYNKILHKEIKKI